MTTLVKTSSLAAALKFLLLGDDGFGKRCAPRIDRTLIWKYRTGRKIPRADTALNILQTLGRLGVELTLERLLAAPRRRAMRGEEVFSR